MAYESRLALLLTGAMLVGACAKPREGDAAGQSAEVDPASRVRKPSVRSEEPTMLTVKSTAFIHNGEIPRRFTSQGEDVSPPLAWSGAPAGTKSFVLIVDDPDAPDPAAPKRVWVHWIVIDIPSNVSEFAEGLSALPAGARSGKNDWNRATYGGPSPPIGRHRYFFKLYALDRTLKLEHPTKAQVEQAMQGHVLGYGELVGTYQKS